VDVHAQRSAQVPQGSEFLKSMGYPTEREAFSIVRSGNVLNVPYSVDNVKWFFDIYGAQVAGLRGKTTKKKITLATMYDTGLKEQIIDQVLVGDVMHVACEKFFISMSSPLELTIVTLLKGLEKEDLGTGVQSHLSMLQIRGFNPIRLMVNPHKMLTALETSFPGTEVDLSGAGDHLSKIDSKIRRVKEAAWSIVAGLPFKLGRARAKDLVTYAVSRVNMKSTSGLNDCTCPSVRFTGLKPEFKNEFGLAFRDYVEVYNPRAENRSNDMLTMRTEPCITLYPSANKNGSWVMLNLNSNSYDRRSQWRKLPTRLC
jgi:hypothetical protein